MDTIYYTLNPWWEGRAFESGINRVACLDKVPTFLARKQIEVLIGSRRTHRQNHPTETGYPDSSAKGLIRERHLLSRPGSPCFVGEFAIRARQKHSQAVYA